jgi:Mu-like prophage I protein
VDWTSAGERAVRGRDYSYLSPSFLLADNKIVGLPQSGSIGSLVNNPAFQSIRRIAASESRTEDVIAAGGPGSFVGDVEYDPEQMEIEERAIALQADALARAERSRHAAALLNATAAGEGERIQSQIEAKLAEARRLHSYLSIDAVFPCSSGKAAAFFSERLAARRREHSFLKKPNPHSKQNHHYGHQKKSLENLCSSRFRPAHGYD